MVESENPQIQDEGGERRVIGGWGSLSIVAGSMLGINIFIVPPLVAQYVETE